MPARAGRRHPRVDHAAGGPLPPGVPEDPREQFVPDDVKTPELAAQVTLQPVERLGVDAAILDCDILIPVEAMGVPLEFHDGKGPLLGKAIRGQKDVDSLIVPDPAEKVPFVMEAIRILRKELDGKVPLIGFSGAPFTLASYIVEGGLKNFIQLKK